MGRMRCQIVALFDCDPSVLVKVRDDKRRGMVFSIPPFGGLRLRLKRAVPTPDTPRLLSPAAPVPPGLYVRLTGLESRKRADSIPHVLSSRLPSSSLAPLQVTHRSEMSALTAMRFVACMKVANIRFDAVAPATVEVPVLIHASDLRGSTEQADRSMVECQIALG
jgi:hypothetical protein